MYITGINYDTGVVTVSADVSGGSYTWGSTDTVFQSGDHTDSTITCPVGMRGWVPTTEPTGSFFGVTRTGILGTCNCFGSICESRGLSNLTPARSRLFKLNGGMVQKVELQRQNIYGG